MKDTVITQETLDAVKKCELEIMKTVDAFCRDNDIKYSLAYGTMLGAVRHKGFIPWDDDIDIFMRRSDFDKFQSLWQENHPKGYFLVNKQLYPGYTQGHSKIEMENTTFLQDGEEGKDYPKGIFIDIFPVDRIPGGLRRKLYFFRAFLGMVYTRGFVPPEANALLKLGTKVLLALVAKKYRLSVVNRITKSLTKYEGNEGFGLCSIVEHDALLRVLPPDLFDEYTDIEFAGEKFLVITDYDYFLRRRYGEYMNYPPKDEQVWTHHPRIIDFNKSIEEICNE